MGCLVMRNYDYDVIIIGTGGAGLRAGIEAKKAGANVLLMSKGPVKQTGCTVSAIFSYCASFGHADANDSPAIHQKDIIKSGEAINDPSKVQILAENAPQSILDLENYGAKFAKEGNMFKQAWLPGHSFPRACYYQKLTGKEMVRALAKEVTKLGIKVQEYVYVIDILVEANQVCGVLCYDLMEGAIYDLHAPAVIIAAGGGGQVYSLNTNPREITGDGYAFGYRSGAKLVDMEFVQMYPTIIVDPIGARGVEIPTGSIIPEGARLYDREGKEFFTDYIPDGDIRTATRDTLSRAIATAIRDGRATLNGGVYLDASMLTMSKETDQHRKYLLDLGIDIFRKPVEVAPGAHFFMGGIMTDADCSTDIRGFYACGEVAGGVHGANRLAGNALPETQVFGSIAGQQAAQYALQQKFTNKNLPNNQADYWRKWLETEQDGTILPVEFKKRVQDLMNENVGVLRDAEKLVQTLEHLNVIENDWMLKVKLLSRELRFNWAFAEVLELRNMITTAKLITRGALERCESRGAHNRIDFPEKSEKYLGNVMLYEKNDNMIAELKNI